MAYFANVEGEVINEYLKSSKGALFASSTVAKSSVSADSNGNRVLRKGTLLATIGSGTDSGKVGPYSVTAEDGRQTPANVIGFCDVRLNLRNGDMEAAYLYGGVVDSGKVIVDGVMGALTDDIKSALQSSTAQILFR